MKKHLKFLVITSCLATSAHNGDASSYFGGRFAAPKVAAVATVPLAAYGIWWHSNLFSVQSAEAPKDCGCNACPHTLATKPLSPEASNRAYQEFIKFKLTLPGNETSASTVENLTAQQWYSILRKTFTEKVVPGCELHDHHRDFDAALKRMLSESDYNALVEAGIYKPLSPTALYALQVITTD